MISCVFALVSDCISWCLSGYRCWASTKALFSVVFVAKLRSHFERNERVVYSVTIAAYQLAAGHSKLTQTTGCNNETLCAQQVRFEMFFKGALQDGQYRKYKEKIDLISPILDLCLVFVFIMSIEAIAIGSIFLELKFELWMARRERDKISRNDIAKPSDLFEKAHDCSGSIWRVTSHKQIFKWVLRLSTWLS